MEMCNGTFAIFLYRRSNNNKNVEIQSTMEKVSRDIRNEKVEKIIAGLG